MSCIKTLAAFVIALTLAFSAEASITVVQSGEGTQGTSVSTWTQAFASNITAGNLLYVCVRAGVINDAITSISDTQGNTWVVFQNQNASALGNTFSTAYCLSAKSSGADTITFNISSAQPNDYCWAEVSGGTSFASPGFIWTTDTAGAFGAGTGTALATSNVTTTGSNDIFLFYAQAAVAITPTGGYTALGTGGFGSLLASMTQTAPGTFNATGTVATSNNWGIILTVFQATPITGGAVGNRHINWN